MKELLEILNFGELKNKRLGIIDMTDIREMNVNEFMSHLLNLSPFWAIEKLDFNPDCKTLIIHLTHALAIDVVCPLCGESDVELRESQRTTCRYFPLCEYHTQIESPRYWIICPQHGPQKVKTPWEDKIDEYLSLTRTM